MQQQLPRSLMGFASQRLNRSRAFFMPRPKRALPTTVLPILPSFRVCLSNRRCVLP